MKPEPLEESCRVELEDTEYIVSFSKFPYRHKTHEDPAEGGNVEITEIIKVIEDEFGEEDWEHLTGKEQDRLENLFPKTINQAIEDRVADVCDRR